MAATINSENIPYPVIQGTNPSSLYPPDIGKAVIIGLPVLRNCENPTPKKHLLFLIWGKYFF
ncbi:hypothetical protein RINTHH_22360 [Richelia intracellularis HH01]|uniref:Uncharacterized protein n=1 Tax=Richelia intracellularis HH01 TaxID=1165094 RepID=M1X6R6_9NOST|nr:hypothetical protein RINTHH_22360 [Richelia intracellularis HH01]